MAPPYPTLSASSIKLSGMQETEGGHNLAEDPGRASSLLIFIKAAVNHFHIQAFGSTVKETTVREKKMLLFLV